VERKANEEVELIMLHRYKFIITTKMKSGDVWETIRHTKDGLDEVISNILKDDEVTSFSVEEKRYA
jgi:hypothetical protein